MSLRFRTSSSRAETMYSRLVSLKPPFFALVNGVRMASVMTMSSAFLEVLCSERQIYANFPGQVVLGN
jgi:hypothetical protein